MKAYSLLATLLCLSFLGGCGGRPAGAPVVAPVAGTVTVNGQPLQNGEIIFYPTKGRSARGEIKDGKIQKVTTTIENDGAPVGDVQVAIFSQVKDDKDPSGMGTKSLINTKYNDPAKSELSAKIETGKSNEIRFDLKD